jgi:hypothetical protein
LYDKIIRTDLTECLNFRHSYFFVHFKDDYGGLE